jgi:hypothetical protein
MNDFELSIKKEKDSVYNAFNAKSFEEYVSTFNCNLINVLMNHTVDIIAKKIISDVVYYFSYEMSKYPKNHVLKKILYKISGNSECSDTELACDVTSFINGVNSDVNISQYYGVTITEFDKYYLYDSLMAYFSAFGIFKQYKDIIHKKQEETIDVYGNIDIFKRYNIYEIFFDTVQRVLKEILTPDDFVQFVDTFKTIKGKDWLFR